MPAIGEATLPATPSTLETVSASPSTSVSFARTPRAATLSVVSWSVLSVSRTATGASFNPFTVMVRVTLLPSVVPSFTVYKTLVVSESPTSRDWKSACGSKM